MRLTDNLKRAIDELQTRTVPCYESDYILLIFDNKTVLNKYKIKHKYRAPNKILITLEDLKNLAGLKFKRFHFVTDDEVYE
jgi:hypothetical protein|nr:MAG TPA: hypothetical protein [Caudoviricetes sp.]